ncbi:MAG: hypothetical protein M9962_03985 [Oligoflexia bacterium]|nr:hypothetical protein [Oligoflexia bacterium]
MSSRRIMFYSHDTFGLGHIRRTQKIANAIANDETSILIACSSPMANSYLSQKGIEYLNLPGFAKQVSGEYLPRSLNIPLAEFVSLRSSLLLSAVKNFRPHMLVVDKEPLGVKGELLPALRYIKEKNLGTKLVCGFRDILDEKEKVAEEWSRKGVLRCLEEYYDSILVYGEKKNFDFVQEYSLTDVLAEKITYTGYVQPKENLEQEDFLLNFEKKSPIVTFTLGGGGDGWEYLNKYLEMFEKGLYNPEINYVLLAGPFADIRLVQRAKKIESLLKNFKVFGFLSNSIGLFQKSDVVVSMGGYNTVVELLNLKKFPIIIPRITPRREQLIRAEAFSSKGLCDYIHPDDLTPERLSSKINSIVTKDRTAVSDFLTNGIENVTKFIDESLEKCKNKSDSSSKVIPA